MDTITQSDWEHLTGADKIPQLKKIQIDKALSKLYRTEDGAVTLRQLLNGEAVSFETSEEPKYEFNRRKFNAMMEREQREYEQRLQQIVIRYYGRRANGCVIPITKGVYEYALMVGPGNL